MLKRLDRLWVRQLIISFITVLAALLVIDFLGKVFDEVGDVGDNDYSLTAMLVYCLSIIPSRIHTFFPMAFLVGSLVGLGRLAVSSELTVMQVSGYSRWRIAFVGMLVAVLTGTAVLCFSEFIAQPLKQFAESYRISKRGVVSNDIKLGFWAQDSQTILRVNGVNREGKLASVRQFRYPANNNGKAQFHNTLNTIVNAREAEFVKGGWLLHDVTTQTFTDAGIIESFTPKEFWRTRLEPTIAAIIASNPEDLSLRELIQFSRYQSANGIDAKQHKIFLLSRILLPLTGAVMLILALPFSFGHARSNSLGPRIGVGIGLGLLYFVIAGSITNIVILTGMPISLGALTPIIIFLFLGLIGLKLTQ